MSKTFTGTYATTQTLSSATNDPATIATTAKLNAGLVATKYNWYINNLGAITNANAGAFVFNHYGKLTNQSGGVILGVGTGSSGVVLNGAASDASAVVVNQSGGSIGGQTGVLGVGSNSTVINAGSIFGSGTGSYGVSLQAGGLVTNQSSGRITASVGGVYLYGGELLNAGAVSGADGVKVAGTTSGAVVNQSGGVISGTSLGVMLAGAGTRLTNQTSGSITGATGVEAAAAATIVNVGAISGTASDASGVSLAAGAVLTNQSGGTIAGYNGVYAASGMVTITNAGSITASSDAIRVTADGLVTNQVGGLITADGFGVYLGNGQLVNAGSIQGDDFGAVLENTATGTNQSGGVISSNAVGVSVYDGLFVNQSGGSIAGGNTGVSFAFGGNGTISNQSGGTITGTYGVAEGNLGAPTVVNAGMVSGSSIGVFFQNTNATVINLATGTIAGATGAEALTVSNAGSIYGTSAGVTLYSYRGHVAFLTNLAGGVISSGSLGVKVTAQHAGDGTTTLTNAGTISGTTKAVEFANAANNRLIVDPGAVFNGTVDANNTTSSTLELATGASAGTLSGFGSQFIDFAQIVVDANADWKLASSNLSGTTLENFGTLLTAITLAGGATLLNESGADITASGIGAVVATGSATIVNAGSITGGTAGILLDAGSAVANQASGTISGVIGVYAIGTAATVTNAGRISGSSAAVELAAGFANRLIVDPGASFSGSVDGGNAVGAAPNSTLELASSASGGTLSALGTQFIDFANVTIDAGSDWTLSADSLGAGYTVTDAGTLINTGSIGSTVTLDTGAVLTNASGGTIAVSAAAAVYGSGASATVLNSGSIQGNPEGVDLKDGGLVDNQAGATIAGVYGVTIAGAAGTVVNTGSIRGSSATGVTLSHGGAITNQSGGTISGATYAVRFQAGYSNLLVVDPGAVFGGTVDGGNTIGAATVSTLTLASAGTAGTLSGLGSKYIHFGNITVASGATWSLTSDSLVSGYTITDSGTLTNSGTLGSGVTLGSGGRLTNASSGKITASGTAVTGPSGTAATVVNAGSISASTDAVLFSAGAANRLIIDPGAAFTGSVNGGNTIGASVASTLELASAASGGTLSGLGTQFVNFAQVTVDAGAAWTLTTSDTIQAGVTLTNSGTLASTVTLGGGGVLSNASTGTITASGTAVAGPNGAAATVVNAGSISASSDAVLFVAGSANLLVIDPGAAFTGTVDGGNTIGSATHSVLALASGASSGTLSGLGTQFVHFAQVTISAGARWTLTGESVTSGTTLTDNGTLTNAGSLATAVTLAAGAYLDNLAGATITSAGGLAAGYGVARAMIGIATVTNAGVIAASNTITGLGVYLGHGGSLTNQTGGTISGVNAVAITNGAGSVVNAGVLSASSTALRLAAGYANRLTVDPGAVFVGTVDGGNTIGATTASTLELASGASVGTLSGLGSQLVHLANITVDSGASWSFAADSIASGYTIIDSGTLTNTGTLGSGVTLGSGASLTNASGGRIAASGTAVTGPSVGAATVVNAGSISASADAVLLHAGAANRLVIDPGAAFTGTVDGGNTIGAAIASTLELASAASAATLSSFGSRYIHFANITVDAGANWSFASDSVASGYTITDNGTLTNTATLGSGVTLGSGAHLTNASGGRIIASGMAVTGPSGGAATVVNAGSISASTDAVLFMAGAANRLVIDPGAAFTGTVDGGNTIGATAASTLELASGATTGVLNSLGSQYIHFANIIVDAGATWSLAADTIASGYTLTNSSTLGSTVNLAGGAVLSNALVGEISSSGNAVVGSGGAVVVVNAGAITASGDGVLLSNGGTVTNQTDAMIAGYQAVYIDGVAGSVVNAGTISGDISGYGVDLGNGGTITNLSGGTISGGLAAYVFGNGAIINQSGGTITGGQAARLNGAGTVTNGGVIAGSGARNVGVYLPSGGTLINQATGTISGTKGVYVRFVGGTVTNAGSIGGTTDAVLLAGGFTNRLIVDPGAVFSGTVDGSNTIGAAQTSTLELASGASAGTLSGLGSRYIDFAQTTIDAGASWTLTGANTLASGGTITNAGTLTLLGATLTDAGTLVNNGAITIDPSTLTAGALTGTGTVTIDAGGTLITTGTVASTETIAFATTTGAIDLTPGSGNFAGLIDGFATGDTISLTGITDVTAVNLIDGNTTLAITTGSEGTIELAVGAMQVQGGTTFQHATSGGNTAITADDLPCFVAGTCIDTPDGPVAVEALRAGDLVLLASGGTRQVRWIGHRHLDLTRHPDPRRAQPIRIVADAIADGAPRRDLLVSPDHAVFIDGGLVPARLLVNDATIGYETIADVTYFHVELDAHDVLLAEGLPAESYLDTGNRGTFENAGLPLVLHPDFTMVDDQARRVANSCAPLFNDAARVEPIWRRLAERATALGHALLDPEPTTTDPALCLMVDGHRIAPVGVVGARHVFILPSATQEARLVSRHAAPCDARPWVEDHRQLGVMVRQIKLQRGGEAFVIPMDHPTLREGWWAPERDATAQWRWTDGDARLLLPEGGLATLEIEIVGTLDYALPTRPPRLERVLILQSTATRHERFAWSANRTWSASGQRSVAA